MHWKHVLYVTDAAKDQHFSAQPSNSRYPQGHANVMMSMKGRECFPNELLVIYIEQIVILTSFQSPEDDPNEYMTCIYILCCLIYWNTCIIYWDNFCHTGTIIAYYYMQLCSLFGDSAIIKSLASRVNITSLNFRSQLLITIHHCSPMMKKYTSYSPDAI